jgi:hypothetical protein
MPRDKYLSSAKIAFDMRYCGRHKGVNEALLASIGDLAMTVSFHISTADRDAVDRIVDRALKIGGNLTGGMSKAKKRTARTNLLMDITACHANGTPLRLSELADADDFNIAHDVFGISRHIDRETGQLNGCFLPRYAQREQVSA